MNSKIECPFCHKQFSPDEVITHKIEAEIKQKYELDAKNQVEEVRKKAKEWQDSEKKKYEEEAKESRQKVEEDIRKRVKEESEHSQKMMQEELSENKMRSKKLMDELTEMTRELRKAREEKEEARLEMEKRLSEESQKISEQAEKRVKDEYQVAIADKDKLLSDALKANEDLKQKLTQGSQQLQGEVQELELEEKLKVEFPSDAVDEVKKGKDGADIIQIVVDSRGRECGRIVWESKRAKHFGGTWIDDLKRNIQLANGDIGVLVSTVLPKEIEMFGYKDGIYITDTKYYLQIATLLRKALIDLENMKSLSVGKNEKIENLYRYIVGSEFAQKIDSMLSAYKRMSETLEKQKMVTLKLWAEQEKQISSLKQNTISIYGSLSGLIDEPLQEIESLKMDNFEYIETTRVSVSDGEIESVQTQMISESKP